jgi:hypothetical protein
VKRTTKVTGLTLAGLTTAGVAIVAIGTGPSTTVARTVGQSRAYTASSNAGQTAVQHADTTRHRARPTTVALTSRYAVRNVRAGHSVAGKVGRRWRAVGTLRATDRRVRGATVLVRRQATVVAVVGRHAVTLVVPPRAVVVVADNGRIGVVGWRFLRKVTPMTPTPTSTTAAPTTPPMTPPAVSPTQAPSGSQAPVVGGLKGRVSTKW